MYRNNRRYMERTNRAKTWKNERENGRDWQSESGCSCCAGNSGCPKRSSLKNWKGREEGEDPGKEGKRKQKDIFQVLGVRRWRELVADRKKWKDIVRQAKAHSGL